MNSELFILGVGASVDYEYEEITLDLAYGEKRELKSNPLPLSNNFLTVAIEREVLKDTYYPNFWEYLDSKYQIKFEDLKNGRAFDVEQFFIDLYDEERSEVDEDKRIRIYLIKADLIRTINELLKRYIYSGNPCLNHFKLAQHCIKTKSNIISFNWDTLMDDALFVTKQWHYFNGYGINFLKSYFDGKEVTTHIEKSKCLLLKPHGSMNWFKYMNFISSDTDGFTGEFVSDEESKQIGLFCHSFKRRNLSERGKLALSLGKNYEPPLKMAVQVDIIPPGEKFSNDRLQYQVKSQMENSKKITIIGFALKESDKDSMDALKQARKQSKFDMIDIEIVNKSKGDKLEEKRLRDICVEIFSPCNIIFKHDTFKNFCESLS